MHTLLQIMANVRKSPIPVPLYHAVHIAPVDCLEEMEETAKKEQKEKRESEVTDQYYNTKN